MIAPVALAPLRRGIPPVLPQSFAHSALIETCARVRLLCEAIGIDPADVRLDDLAPAERTRMLIAGQRDLWSLINSEVQ